MTETAEHPSPAVLRRLSTLRDLPQEDLQALAHRLLVHEDPKGTVLLQMGSADQSKLFLLGGSCRLVAADGRVKIIEHTDASALSPLARLRPSQYQVIAESNVRYLRIEDAVFDQTAGKLERNSSMMLDSYQVEEEEDLGHMTAENRLTLQIYEDLNSDRLLLPSLPHVAVQIGEAVNADNSDAHRVATLIETDPAIALKIVKAANSARYGGVSQVATVSEAVTRLGMHNTRILVVTFALRELFRTRSKKLQKHMLTLWEHSRRIAALARVLADKVGNFNSHEALLAGLVHDIGGLAVIGYARDFPEVVEQPAALKATLDALRGQLSPMILSKWQLPDELVSAAKEAENWLRDHPGKPDYADLVIVAQLHEGMASGIDPTKVTALARLGLSADELGGGGLLHNAHAEVAAVKMLLTG